MAIKKVSRKGAPTRKQTPKRASKGQSKTGRPDRPTGVKRTLKTSTKQTPKRASKKRARWGDAKPTRKQTPKPASKGQSKTGRPARPTGVKRTLKTSRKLKQWR